jgi:RHS repeat-associated protein
MADGIGTQSYSYDDLNNVTAVTTKYGSGTLPPAQTFTYTFNSNGSRDTLMIQGVGMFKDSYDSVGRMTGLTNPESESSSWSYNDNNTLQSQTLGNQAYTLYQYNQIGDLKELTNYQTKGGAALTDFGGMNSLKHDGPGNPLGYTASVPSYSGQTSYSYTPPMGMPFQEQVTQEQSNRISNGGSGSYTNLFSYDLAGNITLFKSGSMMSYNADNQNTALTNYDNNGSPYYRQAQALRYDPENRLTQVGAGWTAGYTGDGLRAWKQAPNASLTYFYYDGAVPVLETNQNGTVTAVNTYGPNGLLSRHTSSGTTYYTFDLQGSVTQRLNSTGGLMDSHLFDAYGTEISPKSTGDPFAFGAQWGYYTDQATISDTGMLLCTWRYYDPTTGRFLTRDPIGYAGGLNLYAFAGNNPVSFADPSGTNPLLCGAIGAGIGAIIGGGVAYVHHQHVLKAVVRGAVVGGVTGFFTCLGAPEVGAGFLGGAASGAVGGAIGDAYGQATAIAFGWQDCFNWPELLSSAALGGANRRKRGIARAVASATSTMGAPEGGAMGSAVGAPSSRRGSVRSRRVRAAAPRRQRLAGHRASLCRAPRLHALERLHPALTPHAVGDRRGRSGLGEGHDREDQPHAQRDPENGYQAAVHRGGSFSAA